MDLWKEWQERGLIYQFSEGAEELLQKQKVCAYIGFDPTAPSLHLGNLLPIVALEWLKRAGHKPIAVIGTGTGLIGDPSGKTSERPLLLKEQVEKNAERIAMQLQKLLGPDVLILYNSDWLSPLSLIDFLRDIGKHFSVSYMLDKESVQMRMQSEEGISFTEFSYMLLQAMDFLYLFDHYHCVLQLGGRDQWGNITAGLELIRKLRNQRAYGIVFPLLLTSTGIKFGKTEAGSLWLDPTLLSPYRLYQFLFNTSDADVLNYLKWFTFLPQSEIHQLEESLRTNPEKREAQRTLAASVTEFLHGPDAVAQVEKASRALFQGELSEIPPDLWEEVFTDVPSTTISLHEFGAKGLPLVDLLVRTGLASSRSDARRLIQSGGAYLNNTRISDINFFVTPSHCLHNFFLVLRKGVKQYHLIKVQQGTLSPE
ncbi:MAG: tyrosine--tRNA ligase [bacterium JZ-2024 1]